jgi:hypothetical protein
MGQNETWNASPSASLRTEALNRKLAEAGGITIGSGWLHKKGGRYIVTGKAIDTDTGDVRIQYKRFGGPGYDPIAERDITFSRPLSEWTVDRFIELR